MLRRIATLWQSLVKKSRLDRDVDEELQAYLEESIDRKCRAGMDPDAARRAALADLGGVSSVKDEIRMGRTGHRVESAWLDLRHAWRMIFRMPGLSAVVILSLGVGIGVNTAVFSWIQALVLRPIPGVPDVSRFHPVETRAEAGTRPGASWPEYRDLRERVRGFDDLIASRMVPLSLGEAGRTERVSAQLVSDNYFAALACAGRSRASRRTKRRAGGEPIVVISHGFWRSRFGGAPAALGRTLRLNDQNLTIVGVAPPGFQGTVLGLDFDLWVPATLAPALFGGSRELEDRSQRGYALLGSLPPHAALARVQTELDAAMAELARLYPDTNAGVQAEVLTFWQALRGPPRMLARALWILQALMLLLLLAVCGTRPTSAGSASTRQREIGARLTSQPDASRIAAHRERPPRCRARAGHGHAWGTDALRAVPSTSGPIRFQTRVDAAALAFAGLPGSPAAGPWALPPSSSRGPAARASARARADHCSRMRNALMGPKWRCPRRACRTLSSSELARHATPIPASGARASSWPPTTSGRGSTTRARALATRFDGLRALPGVEAAAIARSVPLDIHGLPLRSFTLEGRARTDGVSDQALVNTVTPGYFRTMGIPLLDGADLADLADRVAPPQVIVNEQFARRYLSGVQPLGRRLESRGGTYVITGVVRNSLYEAVGEPAIPMLYFSYRDRPSVVGEIHLRTRTGTETAVLPAMRRVVRDIDPTLPASAHAERTRREEPSSVAFRPGFRRPRPAPPRPRRHRHLRGAPCRGPPYEIACAWPWAPGPNAWWRRIVASLRHRHRHAGGMAVVFVVAIHAAPRGTPTRRSSSAYRRCC